MDQQTKEKLDHAFKKATALTKKPGAGSLAWGFLNAAAAVGFFALVNSLDKTTSNPQALHQESNRQTIALVTQQAQDQLDKGDKVISASVDLNDPKIANLVDGNVAHNTKVDHNLFLAFEMVIAGGYGLFALKNLAKGGIEIYKNAPPAPPQPTSP